MLKISNIFSGEKEKKRTTYKHEPGDNKANVQINIYCYGKDTKH